MLSDIAAAGDAARHQLEQMTGVTQDFIHLHSRVDSINDRMTVLLKGIVYLISLRWAFFRHNSSESASDLAPAAGSEVVNEVMSNPRPFSFDSAILNVTTEAAAVDVAQTEAAVATVATQTDDTDSDRILSIVNPVVAKHGIKRVLWRLRQLMSVISDTIVSSDDEVGEDVINTDSVDIRITTSVREDVGNTDVASVDIRITSRLDSTEPELSPVTSTELSPVTSTERSPVTELPFCSPVAVTDSSDRLESTVLSSDFSTLQSESEITPRRLDESFRVTDNPIFQPTSASSSPIYLSSAPPIEPQNPLHRHSFFRLSKLFPSLWGFLLNKFGY